MSARGDQELRNDVYWFLLSNRAASLATVSPQAVPHAATIYFIVDEKFNFYFSTHAQGRKFENLATNPKVAMTISNEKTVSTVQLTGMASRVEDYLEEQQILFELLRSRYKEDPNWQPPPLKMFERGETNQIAIIKVVPYELSYGNFELAYTGEKTKQYTPFFQPVISRKTGTSPQIKT
jgi:general stress protein 26